MLLQYKTACLQMEKIGEICQPLVLPKVETTVPEYFPYLTYLSKALLGNIFAVWLSNCLEPACLAPV